ncbi:hypothetical protein L1887_23279 [Cichorium endivia]|nr:hypothetical protein L1887_23279 [Cichorium endivia]
MTLQSRISTLHQTFCTLKEGGYGWENDDENDNIKGTMSSTEGTIDADCWRAAAVISISGKAAIDENPTGDGAGSGAATPPSAVILIFNIYVNL